MLVLSRKTQEGVIIGHFGEIVVKLISVQRGRVKIGIDCPREIRVMRKEIAGDRALDRREGEAAAMYEDVSQ